MDEGENACPQCGHRLVQDTVYRADYSPEDILDLGISQRLADFVFLDPKPGALDYWCVSWHSGWACAIPEDVTLAYPLWATNADITAVWLRGGWFEFVHLYHDDPTFRVLARTEQGLLLQLFLCLFESEDWHDETVSMERLKLLATVAGFNYLVELDCWHRQYGGTADFSARWEEFVAEIEARSEAAG